MATILAFQEVAPRHFLMTLSAPNVARAARAGQFVHVLPREARLFDPLLRRAFSIMAARPDTGEIDILFRVEGSGTAQIAAKSAGESLDLIGPLGQPFDLRLFHVKQPEHERQLTPKADILLPVEWESSADIRPVLVGGGVGVPPLIFLGKTFRAARLEPLTLIGARSAAEVLGVAQLGELRIETRVATDDGSDGHTGRVTELLEIALQNGPRAVVYACGPLPMLRAVAALSARYQAPCQVSLEENMPCGIGVCNGCVVAMKVGASSHQSAAQNASDYERYQRVCVAGPALWADRVDWEAK